MTLTEEEIKWIKSLKRLMSKKPKSIWFFNNGDINVMKYNENGEVALTEYDGIDPEYVLAIFSDIYSEGGDF